MATLDKSKLTPGDKLKCTNPDGPGRLKLGQIYTFDKHEFDFGGQTMYVKEISNVAFYYSRFELYKKQITLDVETSAKIYSLIKMVYETTNNAAEMATAKSALEELDKQNDAP